MCVAEVLEVLKFPPLFFVQFLNLTFHIFKIGKNFCRFV